MFQVSDLRFGLRRIFGRQKIPDLARCVQSIHRGKNIGGESGNEPTQNKLVLFVPKHIGWIGNFFLNNNGVLDMPLSHQQCSESHSCAMWVEIEMSIEDSLFHLI